MATTAGPNSPETYGSGLSAEAPLITTWSISSGQYRPELFSYKNMPGQRKTGLEQTTHDIESIEAHYPKKEQSMQILLYAMESTGTIPSKAELYHRLQAVRQTVGDTDPALLNEQLDDITRQAELLEGVETIIEHAAYLQSLYSYGELNEMKELTKRFVGRPGGNKDGEPQVVVPCIRTLNVMEQRGLIGRARRLEDIVRIIIAWQEGITLPKPAG